MGGGRLSSCTLPQACFAEAEVSGAQDVSLEAFQVWMGLVNFIQAQSFTVGARDSRKLGVEELWVSDDSQDIF